MSERRARKSAPTAAEPPSPDSLATLSSPSATNELNLPPIAADAGDLEPIKKAVDDAASIGGGLWLSYIFVLFYLAIAAGAVTHADLFFENPVKLPFLNIELPLLAFFLLAPILFVIVHAYTLVHLVFLTDKARQFNDVLKLKFGEVKGQSRNEQERRKAITDGLRRQLPGNIFVQILAGPRSKEAKVPPRGSDADGDKSSCASVAGWIAAISKGLKSLVGDAETRFRRLMLTIAWATLAVGPVLLLLLIQLQFLPFHDSQVTWTHRFALVVDLILLWWLWRKILQAREREGLPEPYPKLRRGIGATVTVSLVLFSCLLATFPGEPQLDLLEWDRSGATSSLYYWIFAGQFDELTLRRESFFASTLVLPGLDIYEGLKIDDPDKVKWRDYVFHAGGRDFRGAKFYGANLPKVNFQSADLRGASFASSHLQGALLNQTQLEGAFFLLAQLQGASLLQAQLQGASLVDAQLQGASLIGAELQGASLASANLQGASLDNARLQGADLDWAKLQGASLDGAQLEGASLEGAQLQGASLDRAQLEGASLDSAQLQGASLQLASLQATDLWDAYLWRTNQFSPLGDWQINTTKLETVRLSKAFETWRPVWQDLEKGVQPWNDEDYQDLRHRMGSGPPEPLRADALNRIRRLDCLNPDKALASCDPSIPPPPEAAAWQSSLENAGVDYATYVGALATVLKALVCSGRDEALYILRRLTAVTSNRIEAVGPEAPALIDFIMSKDCPVSASLTEADKAKLLGIKQDAIKKPGG